MSGNRENAKERLAKVMLKKAKILPENYLGRAATLWSVLTQHQRYLVLRLLTVSKTPAMNLSTMLVREQHFDESRWVRQPRHFTALPRWIRRSLKRMFMTQERTISVRTFLRKRGETEIAI